MGHLDDTIVNYITKFDKMTGEFMKRFIYFISDEKTIEKIIELDKKTNQQKIKKIKKRSQIIMTKKELIKKIALANKTSISKTEEFYRIFEKTLIEAITTNEEIVLFPKIGKFKLKSRKAYIGRNPKTKKKIKIPVKKVVIFKLSKTIKDKVKTLILK
ncbi:MAG: HU family DNA-binding protein [Columbia Basin potato purple top phytoplasma]